MALPEGIRSDLSQQQLAGTIAVIERTKNGCNPDCNCRGVLALTLSDDQRAAFEALATEVEAGKSPGGFDAIVPIFDRLGFTGEMQERALMSLQTTPVQSTDVGGQEAADKMAANLTRLVAEAESVANSQPEAAFDEDLAGNEILVLQI